MASTGDKAVFHLRNQLLQDQNLGELARDVQRVLNLINPVSYRKFRTFYKEPMTLGVFSEPPLCIEMVRISAVNKPELPVRCGGMVHYVYKPIKGGAIITSIDGLTAVGTPIEYDFVFRVTFEASS